MLGACRTLCLIVSHLRELTDGSVRLVVDGKLFSRSITKQAAATMVPRCHVHIDLKGGDVVVTFSRREGEKASVRDVAGEFGNLLISELVCSKLDAQTLAARDLLMARALDGALPRDAVPQDILDGGGGDEG